uniref:Uncharacterized protein n=1 Tax=Chlorella vulgaris TaxID=3077 RepID=V9H150_CHLVU|nr:hypothetical protein ChvulCp060 [Chlorella vulgaris]pir/T07247/ hypothetical protein 54b - Chlorella vulgaris chloroplast [Chlorella vulgaris]QSV10861.1 hypothetical protein [Chlorella vulgaris]BAA57894.1 unnamed protein product [Chlorella vulgaris]
MEFRPEIFFWARNRIGFIFWIWYSRLLWFRFSNLNLNKKNRIKYSIYFIRFFSL